AGETLINCPGRKRPVHAEQFHFFIKLCVIVGGLEFFAVRQTRLQSCTEEVSDCYPWDFARVLKGQEQAAPRPFVRFKFKETLSSHQHLASRDLVVGMTSEHF